MILAMVTDAAGGVSFCGKRQSRDRELTREILRLSRKQTLIADTYSAKLFGEPAPQHIQIIDNLTEGIQEDSFLFLERISEADVLQMVVNQAEKIYLFRWDKHYPADVWLPPGFPGPGWRKAGEKRFAGFSHEKIIEEVWLYEKDA